MQKIHSSKLLLAVVIFSLFVVIRFATAESVFDITFPIPELENCGDRSACKAYCDAPANSGACQIFARKHGLNTGNDSSNNSGNGSNSNVNGGVSENGDDDNSGGDFDRDKAYAAIKADGGPGQCGKSGNDPVNSCSSYCATTTHMSECVAYGKSHGLFSGEALNQAEKVVAAVAQGVALPNGCADEKSCKKTCENPNTVDQAKSCFVFAEKAGLLPSGVDPKMAEKVFNEIQNGTAPFKKPADFAKCENPPDDATLQKCTEFAKRNGLIDESQAQTLIKNQGKGPGGCQGERSCGSYCEEHKDECIKFSEQNGLIHPNQNPNSPNLMPSENQMSPKEDGNRNFGQFPPDENQMDPRSRNPQDFNSVRPRGDYHDNVSNFDQNSRMMQNMPPDKGNITDPAMMEKYRQQYQNTGQHENMPNNAIPQRNMEQNGNMNTQPGNMMPNPGMSPGNTQFSPNTQQPQADMRSPSETTQPPAGMQMPPSGSMMPPSGNMPPSNTAQPSSGSMPPSTSGSTSNPPPSSGSTPPPPPSSFGPTSFNAHWGLRYFVANVLSSFFTSK